MISEVLKLKYNRYLKETTLLFKDAYRVIRAIFLKNYLYDYVIAIGMMHTKSEVEGTLPPCSCISL